MSYIAQFEGWANLTQIDLIVAYRKAKADCFIEDGFPSAIDFAEFEENLLINLDELLEEWKKHDGPKSINSYLGHFRVVPKKLSSKSKESNNNGHTHFSSKESAFLEGGFDLPLEGAIPRTYIICNDN